MPAVFLLITLTSVAFVLLPDVISEGVKSVSSLDQTYRSLNLTPDQSEKPPAVVFLTSLLLISAAVPSENFT